MPIINQLLLIIVRFYSMFPWGLGQSLKKNYCSSALYLSKSCSFLWRFVGAFLLLLLLTIIIVINNITVTVNNNIKLIFLLLLFGGFCLVLKCAINNCLSLLFYCSRSCFTLWIPDSILPYCRRTLPRVQRPLPGEAVSRGHAVCGLWSQPETVHLPVPTRKAWRVFRCMSQP